MARDKDTFVYIGSWDVRRTTTGHGLGITICRYIEETGEPAILKTLPLEIAVGETCLDRKRNILYCVNETTTLPGRVSGGGGEVYAFKIDPETGDLTEINHLPSFGSLPSGLAVDATGKYLVVTHHTDKPAITKVVQDAAGKYRIVAEYDDSTTVLFRLGEDGSIGDPCDIYKYTGAAGRSQNHTVMMSPSGNIFAVCDMNTDQITMFRINYKTEKLELCGAPFQSINRSAPRFCVFHPTRPYLFVNYSDKALVDSLRYDEEGNIERIGTVGALPEGVEDHKEMKQSGFSIHTSGKYLYSLLRGIKGVSVFKINESTGHIERFQTITVEGNVPRVCAVSPDGRFLYVAMLGSDEVLVLAIGGDGKLSPTGIKISHRKPGNVTFY